MSDLVRFATFNIWNRNEWAARLPLIRDGLRALDADVIALHEVLAMPGLPTQADEIFEGWGWHVYYSVAWTIGGGLTFGNAIASRYPLLDTATLPLPTTEGLDTRSVAFARVQSPHGDVPVFATHLTYQLHLGSLRVKQVRALVDHARSLAPIGGVPPIVLGDFNASPDSDEMRFLRGVATIDGESVYFADCWDACRPGELGHTFARDNGYARRAYEPSRRIDYIYSRGPDRNARGEPIHCALALVEPVGGVWPSDHYAVVADVFMKARTV